MGVVVIVMAIVGPPEISLIVIDLAKKSSSSPSPSHYPSKSCSPHCHHHSPSHRHIPLTVVTVTLSLFSPSLSSSPSPSSPYLSMSYILRVSPVICHYSLWSTTNRRRPALTKTTPHTTPTINTSITAHR